LILADRASHVSLQQAKDGFATEITEILRKELRGTIPLCRG
jgi:hypothetical protein